MTSVFFCNQTKRTPVPVTFLNFSAETQLFPEVQVRYPTPTGTRYGRRLRPKQLTSDFTEDMRKAGGSKECGPRANHGNLHLVATEFYQMADKNGVRRSYPGKLGWLVSMAN